MRVLRVAAWLMIIGGLIVGFGCLLLLVVPAHPRPSSSISPASTRYSLASCVCLATSVCVIGAGLRTRLSWAWSGTVVLSLVWAFIGLVVPMIISGTKSAKPATVVAAILIGGIILFPAFFMLRLLFKSAVREAFRIAEFPPVWIRVLALSYFIGSGLTLLSVFSPTPRTPFGLVHNVAAIRAFEIITGVVWLALARGLYSLSESARRWTIYLTLFASLDSVCFFVFDQATPTKLLLRISTLLMTVAISTLTIWYLHTRRIAFARV